MRSKNKGRIFTSKPDRFSAWPERIVCLTAESTEIVFALGAGDRIVGVSGYSVRPPEARRKEKVAAFTSVRMDKIRALQPDLLIGFSDLQKNIARDLVAEGFTVFISNQRSLKEISDTVIAIGRLIGCEEKAVKLARDFETEINRLAPRESSGVRPRIYFEEWDDPLISGIRWVSELIERLGGEDIFGEKSKGMTAKDRTVRPEDVLEADPDVIVASWCGKKVQKDKIRNRPGWERIKAVQTDAIYEIKSSDILQPGLSLLDGARQLAAIFKAAGQPRRKQLRIGERVNR